MWMRRSQFEQVIWELKMKFKIYNLMFFGKSEIPIKRILRSGFSNKEKCAFYDTESSRKRIETIWKY